MRSLAPIAVIALLLPSAACGPSGLPGNTRLDELDADEFNDACVDIFNHYLEEVGEERWHRQSCLEDGAERGDVAGCEDAVTECLMQPSGSRSTSHCVFVGSTCTATIADFEACFDEESGRIAAFIDALSCPAVLDGVEHDPFTGPACQAFVEKCPT